MSTKLFAVFLAALGVLVFAACACTASNFKTIGDRLSWFLEASAGLLVVIRLGFVFFYHGLPGSRKSS